MGAQLLEKQSARVRCAKDARVCGIWALFLDRARAEKYPTREAPGLQLRGREAKTVKNARSWALVSAPERRRWFIE